MGKGGGGGSEGEGQGSVEVGTATTVVRASKEGPTESSLHDGVKTDPTCGWPG